MGLSYLSNNEWSQVTRDERFFCAHLYNLILNRGIPEFLSYINKTCGTDFKESCYWDIGYEVCFYRDLWHLQGRKTELYSPKRTFDLALFSEKTIVIIEAKAFQKFEKDQLKIFKNDISQVKKETGVDEVVLMGLKSDKYEVPEDYLTFFNGPVLNWGNLADFYSGDPVLQRANDIFDPDKGLEYGKNNVSGYMTGIQLEESYKMGEDFFVGRIKGLYGSELRDDIDSGNWKSHRYETNRDAEQPPNTNWFSLRKFMELIKEIEI